MGSRTGSPSPEWQWAETFHPNDSAVLQMRRDRDELLAALEVEHDLLGCLSTPDCPTCALIARVKASNK